MTARFISSAALYDSSWTYDQYNSNLTMVPLSEQWTGSVPPTVSDIKIWEEIYCKPGIIGVYAAWNPYTELYIVYYPLLAGTEFHSLVFVGADASVKVKELIKKYDIVLPTNTVWVNEDVS